jgi:phosphoribosylamine---glycine ligase
MEGEELSVFALTNGDEFVMLPGLQDHKRLLDGDRGPNTGGMGAYVPVSLDAHTEATRAIMRDTLAALRECGRPFTGLLYAGLMLTSTGPRVVEFNCRFGDPETQALMPVLDLQPGLATLMHAIARGEPLPAATPRLAGACVTTVLAAANYPDTPRSGDPIALPPAVDGVYVFHAGTARDAQGRLLTSGGRVFAVSAVAPTIAEAQRRSREYAEHVEFAGRQMRSDIGWREIARRG